MRRFIFIIGLYFITTLILLQGCTSVENEDIFENPFEGIPIIEVRDTFDITDEDAVGTGEFSFRSNFFHHMMIDNRGHFFVFNRGGESIYHFDENGEYLGSIGRSGQGPGEFQGWPVFDTASNDTLYTFNRANMIISRFVNNSGEWNYDYGFTLNSKEDYVPGKILQADQNHLIIEYIPNMSILMNKQDNFEQLTKSYDLLTTSGEIVKQNWLATQASERSVYKGQGGAGAVHMLPYGGRSFMKPGPDQSLYHLWSREFNVHIYNIDGNRTDSLSLPGINQKLSNELREAAVKETVRMNMGTQSEQQALEQQMLDEIPQSAPALKDFHVDRDTGFIIVRRFIFEEQSNWMLIDNEGSRVGAFHLDENLNVYDFRNGVILGSLNEDDSLPTIRVVKLPDSIL